MAAWHPVGFAFAWRDVGYGSFGCVFHFDLLSLGLPLCIINLRTYYPEFCSLLWACLSMPRVCPRAERQARHTEHTLSTD